jgi:hypothetical protein
MQPSRRAFLLGRKAPRTPWQVFCERLRHTCAGTLTAMPAGAADSAAPPHGGQPAVHGSPGPGLPEDAQARWIPDGDADVRQALALCEAHGVVLALAGMAAPPVGRPVLWVDPARLNLLAREPGAVPRWRAGPGVTLGELARAGLPQFAHAAPDTTLAAWYADRGAANWPCGRGDLTGIHAAEVLLADGVSDRLGPFGAQDGEPLRSASLQMLVPALFRVSSSPEAQWCRTQDDWPARYRLDALAPQAPATVNLAHVLHGHGGTLAWLQALVLEAAVDAMVARVAPSDAPTARPARARALDIRVKTLFDAKEIFPDTPDVIVPMAG